jgi:glycosyltransferase involved in cell wall biosynthesis
MYNQFVSIILPNYNHAKYLQKRLDSICNQTYQNFELIVLDDCSTDDSLKLLEAYKSHPKVTHFKVNEKNSGSPFKQWQKGISLAKGDYIWIAESDDFCELNFLESQLDLLQHCDVAVAKTLSFDETTVSKTVAHPIFNEMPEEEQILYCPILNVSCTVFKADLLKKVVNPSFHTYQIIGDRVFYYEFFKKAGIKFNPNTIAYYRQHSSAVSNLQNRKFSYFKNYFDEHFRFIDSAKKSDESLKSTIVKRYISKFFNRINNRLPREKKLSFNFLSLYIKYKYKLFVA